MPLLRNRQPGPTVINDRNADVVIEWEGAGHPMGDDVREVPESVMQNPGLVRALRKGVLERIEESDVSSEFFSQQATHYAATAQAEHEAVMGTMDAPDGSDDLLPTKCLLSGEDIIMRAKDLRERPPLAERFADRALEFVANQTGIDQYGQPIISWSRVTVGDALPSQG